MAEAAESQILTVIRVWAAIAWADGGLTPEEAEGLRRLLRTAELTAEEREAAWRFLSEPVAMPGEYLTSLTPAARRGVYRAGCRVAVVDHVFTQTERRMLDRLRDLLGIPEDGAKEIEAEVPGLV
jgi:tellurite resistance protein